MEYKFNYNLNKNLNELEESQMQREFNSFLLRLFGFVEGVVFTCPKDSEIKINTNVIGISKFFQLPEEFKKIIKEKKLVFILTDPNKDGVFFQ